MKRSSMVDLFAKYLPDHLTVVGCHGDRYEVAVYLLDKLEEAGMLPPYSDSDPYESFWDEEDNPSGWDIAGW